MILGDMLCLVVYYIYIYPSHSKSNMEEIRNENVPKPNMFIFLPSALLYLVDLAMHYVALQYTNVSQYQMLQGSNIIFVGLLSVFFLKKKLEWFRWIGMAVVIIGLVLVGASDLLKVNEEAGMSSYLIGDLIVVCAQVFTNNIILASTK